MELYSEVKVDFKGPQDLASNMKRAAAETRSLHMLAHQMGRTFGAAKKDVNEIVKGSEKLKTNFREMSRFKFAGSAGAISSAGHGGGNAGTGVGGGFSAAATGAAATALFFRAASLANPTSMNRFTDAVDDATAVIGHRLVPYLDKMTEAVRGFGDFMARNPLLAKAAGVGITGVAALGLGGLALAGVKASVGGLKWAGGQVRSGIGWLGGLGEAGLMASQRRDAHLYETAAANVERRGGARAAGAGATVIAPGGRGAGRGASAGAIAGRVGMGVLVAGIAAEGAKEAGQQMGYEDPERSLGKWVDKNLHRFGLGAGLDKARQITGMYPEGEAPPGSSSWAAAARPARYQDTLGAIMAMRQEIGSGAGRDPAERTAVATERIAEKMDQNQTALQIGNVGPESAWEEGTRRAFGTKRGT